MICWSVAISSLSGGFFNSCTSFAASQSFRFSSSMSGRGVLAGLLQSRSSAALTLGAEQRSSSLAAHQLRRPAQQVGALRGTTLSFATPCRYSPAH